VKKRDLSLTFGSGIDELSSVHSFNSDEILSAVLVSVHVLEYNFGKWSATSGVVNDILDCALNVAAGRLANARVERAKLTRDVQRSQEF